MIINYCLSFGFELDLILNSKLKFPSITLFSFSPAPSLATHSQPPSQPPPSSVAATITSSFVTVLWRHSYARVACLQTTIKQFSKSQWLSSRFTYGFVENYQIMLISSIGSKNLILFSIFKIYCKSWKFS